MPTGIRLKSRAIATAATLAGLLALGCSDDGLGKRYYVGGTVKYNGQPVEKGEINFVPANPEGRAASGVIEKGSYVLSTLGDQDGALPGKYEVTITSKDVDLTEAKAKIEKMSGGKMAGANIALPQEMVAKAQKSAKNNIPAKYSTPSTSGLTFEVKEQSNTADFNLTD